MTEQCKWTLTMSGVNGKKWTVQCKGEGDPQYAADGRIWTHLCGVHDDEINEAIKSGNPRLIMRCYVRASGGPEALAESM